MTWEVFVLLGLATYAISQTFTRYNGIDGLFYKLRGDSEFWNCPVCLGWWVSLILTLAAFVHFDDRGFFDFILLWLGVSGVSMVLNLWSDK